MKQSVPTSRKQQYETKTPDPCRSKTPTTFYIECYIDLCAWKGKTSVRWSRNDKKKDRQNRPKTHPDRLTPKNHTDPPPKHTEYLQHSIEKGVNQPNWRKSQCIPIDSSLTTQCSKGQKSTDSSDFFRRLSKATTKQSLPPFPNSLNA